MSENQSYGFIPIAVAAAAGISAILAGGTAFYITKKLYENQYYNCLENAVKSGASIAEAKTTCAIGKKPSIFQQIATIPVVALFAYGVFKSLTGGK